MASLPFVRPRKVSERHFLGDLACLFDRQRRRSGLAITLDSFAADLAASDALRSALFTLCTAISRMGEKDLSPHELLALVARALTNSGLSEGRAQIPPEMREAFLLGYAAWQARIAGDGVLAEWPAGAETSHRDSVVPFPGRKAALDSEHFLDAFARRRTASASISEADNRPPGIDALLAAAPVWASATPLARNADLPPEPQTMAPASLCYDESPVDAERPAPRSARIDREVKARAAEFEAADAAHTEPALGTAMRASFFAQMHSALASLPARRVFFALAGLTVLAGAVAGMMAYRTLHSGYIPRLNALKPSVAYAATVMPELPTTAAVPPVAEAGVIKTAPKPSPAHKTASGAGLHPVLLSSIASPAAMQPSMPAPLQVPAAMMIGNALAAPQPADSLSVASATGGTVAVEITISRLGDVTSAQAVSGPQQDYASAIRTVREWRFRPYMVNGIPVEIATTLQLRVP